MTAVDTPISAEDLARAREVLRPHIHHTPMLRSRTLSELSGFDVRLKAELFQRTGSYKIRGALNKIGRLTDAERGRGVICSSAGNHAQGVALAARLLGVRAVVVMAENATPAKVDATLGYGAEVVRRGQIWDEANDHALELAASEGLTMIHPFDDLDLIAGQATLGAELIDDCPDVDVIVVPIGGGGLISGVASAAALLRPQARVVGVESSDGPAMKASVEAGRQVALERVDTIIDGLRVRQVGTHNLAIVRSAVDEIVTVSDERIFAALVWTMERCKLVLEGAAAAPVAALLDGLIAAPPGATVALVISGGNVDLTQLRGLRWN